jgi:hypothetical protein
VHPKVCRLRQTVCWQGRRDCTFQGLVGIPWLWGSSFFYCSSWFLFCLSVFYLVSSHHTRIFLTLPLENLYAPNRTLLPMQASRLPSRSTIDIIGHSVTVGTDIIGTPNTCQESLCFPHMNNSRGSTTRRAVGRNTMNRSQPPGILFPVIVVLSTRNGVDFACSEDLNMFLANVLHRIEMRKLDAVTSSASSKISSMLV